MNGVWTFLSDGANWVGPDGIWTRIAEHLQYSVLALLIAAVIALPLGALIGHTGKGITAAVGLANLLRALPSLGLLTLLVLWGLTIVQDNPDIPARWGLYVPSILVLVILGIPPILTNTYAGIGAVDPAVRDAASGLGMTGGQVLRKVELPVAAPLIFAGLRSAFLQIVATATILALVVTLGGLGRFILDGPKSPVNPYGIMAGGAVLVAVLAIVGDRVIAAIGYAAISPGLRSNGRPGNRRRRPALTTRNDPAALAEVQQ
ncbi:ABC transporter permease [Nakamurella lactea]|uniref:ABC transporter permease n=1 Tax=Nakamurella lactea TaxID=459515 RepID=UPI000429D0F0|nr:ABC transporter permease subunit [Nakamurella lactea]